MQSDAHEIFQSLLLKYSQQPVAELRQAIEAQLWADFGAKQAVLVFDMSGFSSLCSRYGIVHYLSMVRRMQLTAAPIVQAHGGAIIKFEADNGFAVFADVQSALQAAQALNAALTAANVNTPDELDIRIGCGIDFGSILLIDGQDFFGDAVIRACKLGEDIAKPGEVLLTRSAAEHLPEEFAFALDPLDLTISGIRIEAFQLRGPRA